jgi:hypothetical protein|tara:strand:- start:34394 stop:34531 length:138 start_codon:yes stop_codon:yes gene_type:complete
MTKTGGKVSEIEGCKNVHRIWFDKTGLLSDVRRGIKLIAYFGFPA